MLSANVRHIKQCHLQKDPTGVGPEPLVDSTIFEHASWDRSPQKTLSSTKTR
jgi:hypothetical protein